MAEQTVFHVYIDESSQTGHGFMVIGAIFCRPEAAGIIATTMDQCLLDHRQRPDMEFHWTELKALTLNLYKDVLGRLIGFTRSRRKMCYRALVIDLRQADRSLNRGRNREATLAQFIFALVFRAARRSKPGIAYHLFIDRRADSVHDLEMDQRILEALNTRAISMFGLARGPFAGVTFVDSKACRLIQATDMITGAIAYETNGKHLLNDAAQHRIALWRHVIACSTLTTLAAVTSHQRFDLQIRPFDLAVGELTGG